MLDFWEQFIITTALGFVKGLIHNPAKQAAVKKLLLTLRDDINALYPGE